MYGKMEQVNQLIKTLPAEAAYAGLKKEGEGLVQRMKQWDEDMVQRKSKAYDDMENFPNKFTSNYMFMINHAESDLPRVIKPTLDRLKDLNVVWVGLEKRARQLLDKDVATFNKQLWEAGIGAVWVK